MNIYIEFLKKNILFYVEIEHGGILLYAWNIFVCSQNNSYFLYEFFSCSEYFVFFSEKKIYFDGTSLFLTQNNFVLGMFLFVPEQLLILTEIFFPQKYFCAQNNFLHLYLMAQLIGPFVLLSYGLTYL